MRTQRDIQREQAELKLQKCIIDIYKEFKELNITDIITILSSRLNYESHTLRKYYKLEIKDGL